MRAKQQILPPINKNGNSSSTFRTSSSDYRSNSYKSVSVCAVVFLTVVFAVEWSTGLYSYNGGTPTTEKKKVVQVRGAASSKQAAVLRNSSITTMTNRTTGNSARATERYNDDDDGDGDDYFDDDLPFFEDDDNYEVDDEVMKEDVESSAERATTTSSSNSSSTKIVLAETATNEKLGYTVGDLSTSTLMQRTKLPAVRHSVLMATYMFSLKGVSLRAFRMFVLSAQYAGIDVAIVTDTTPPFPLPSNVFVIQLTWDEMMDRVNHAVFDGTMPNLSTMRHKVKFYKIHDFKPAFAHLFPDIVQHYQYWGHVDNDTLLGNITKYFPPSYLDQWDIISGESHYTKQYPHRTWGPFTIYRNTPVINSLYREADVPLAEIFADPDNKNFDEWGGGDNRRAIKRPCMSNIIRDHADRLGIRNTITKHLYQNDKWDCDNVYRHHKKKGQKKPAPQRTPIPHCGECIFRKGTTTLQNGDEVFMCHFQTGKNNGGHEASLQNDHKFQDLIQAQEFRVGWIEGFMYIDDDGAEAIREWKKTQGWPQQPAS